MTTMKECSSQCKNWRVPIRFCEKCKLFGSTKINGYKLKSWRGFEIFVGLRVTTAYIEKEKNIVRTVTALDEDSSYGSGIKVQLDAGILCPCCGKPKGTLIRAGGSGLNWVDSSWITPVGDKVVVNGELYDE